MPAAKDGRKSKGGRPSSFKPEYAAQSEKMAKLGATDAEMADIFGVAESTFHLWKQAHPEFSEALKRGKLFADAHVAESLYRRATGYEHDAVKIAVDAKTGEHAIIPYVERYPPDTTAAIFWLKNRRRGEWRDKQDHEHAGPNGGPIESVTRVEWHVVDHDRSEA